MTLSDDGRAVRYAPPGPGPMKCLAICQDELVIRVLDEILLPSFEIEFLVESAGALARRMTEAGVHITAGDLKRKDTFHKADISPSTCVIVQDTGKRGLKKVLENIRDAGGTLDLVLGVGGGRVRRARGGNPQRPIPTSRTWRWRSSSAALCSPSSAGR